MNSPLHPDSPALDKVAIHVLQPYPAYKDSGVPWLGKVPEHWDLRSLGSLTSARSERGCQELPLLSVVREKGVILRSGMTDDENHNFVPDDLSNYKIAREGSLVINKMKAWQGSLGIAPMDGIVSPAYYVFDFHIANRRFGAALLRSKTYVGFFGQVSDGVRIGQWDLSIAGMKRIPVPLPPSLEQTAIVKFLGHADRRIRRYIAAKQKLIKLLEEEKEGVIHRAVTRGPDPSVRLKPSGVEWLGDVPEHWKVVRLGRLTMMTSGFPFQSDRFSQSPNDLRLLRGINIAPGRVRWDAVVRWPIDDCRAFADLELRLGDIVLGMDRPIISGGVRVAVITDDDVPSLLLQRVVRIRPLEEELDASFAMLLLSGKSFSDYLAPIFTGISVPHISPEQISAFRVALPDRKEQSRIVNWVVNATGAIGSAMDSAGRQMSLIREYRTRLIAEVVTGKLDVRAAAASLPDEGPEPPPALDSDEDAMADDTENDVGADLAGDL